MRAISVLASLWLWMPTMSVVADSRPCMDATTGLQATLDERRMLLIVELASGKTLREHPFFGGFERQRPDSAVSVLLAGQRRAFVVIDAVGGEIWEISLDPSAPDIPTGFIHDYRLREGEFISGYLNPRRSRLDVVADSWQLSRDHSLLRLNGSDGGVVFSLDARRIVAPLPIDRHPQLRSVEWLPAGQSGCS